MYVVAVIVTKIVLVNVLVVLRKMNVVHVILTAPMTAYRIVPVHGAVIQSMMSVKYVVVMIVLVLIVLERPMAVLW